MKKLLVILLSAVMVLSMIPVMTLTASAAGEGMWTTRRDIGDDDEESYIPCAGYQYTSEGFATISPNYTNTSPFYTIVTKEAQNLKDGFSMKFRIDEFDYKGEDGQADEWITISLWDADSCTPGVTTHGNGWLCLIRGTGEGSANVESYWTEQTDPDKGIAGGFKKMGTDVGVTCEVDSNDKEIYEFEVSDEYVIKVNGVEVAGCAAITEQMNKVKPDGDFFVGITFHTTAPGGNASLTILETNGSKPTGSDSKDPEENMNIPGERLDPSTIPANQPAALFDSNKTSFKKDPSGSNCILSAKGDGSYSVQATIDNQAFFFQWGIKSTLNIEAQDFPVVAMMIRNWMGSESGTIYYSAGDIMGPGASNHESWMTDWDYEWEIEDDFYQLVICDLTEYENYVGQIHSFRFDMVGIMAGEDDAFDVCYIGVFRTPEEAAAYATAYVESKGEIKTEAPTEPKTEKPTEAKTEAPTEAPTTAGETGTGAATEASTKAEKSGCKSVIGGSVALILTAAAAAVALKKKH